MASVALTAAACVLYLGATFAYHASVWGRARRWRGAATRLLAWAVAVHVCAIALRWWEAGYPPLSNGFEGLSFYGWALAAGYLAFEWRRGPSALGALVTPIVLSATAIALVLARQVRPLPPVLRSAWLGVHVSISFLAYVAFTLAFAAAVGYLRQDRVLRGHRSVGWGQDLPPLTALEALGRYFALAGLALLTGSLVTGSIWAERAWGTPWPWQPQQIAALVTWATYVAYFMAWHELGWRGRRPAWLLVAGFVAVVVTFIGAELLAPGGLHSFLFGA